MASEVTTMTRKRRKFSKEFKLETVKLVKEGPRSIGEVARDLDLTEPAVRNWVHRFDVDAGVREGVSTGELALQATQVDENVTTSEQVAELARHDTSPWGQYLNKGIGEYNAKFAVSNAQKIQKYAVVPGDFSEKGGELTATLKLKRGPTTEKYKHLIDAMY